METLDGSGTGEQDSFSSDLMLPESLKALGSVRFTRNVGQDFWVQQQANSAPGAQGRQDTGADGCNMLQLRHVLGKNKNETKERRKAGHFQQ